MLRLPALSMADYGECLKLNVPGPSIRQRQPSRVSSMKGGILMNQSAKFSLLFLVGDEQMTSWLLDHGANPNKRCEIDCTPLSYAVQLAPISVI
ncbi:hypothetical protein N7519_007251 [Penicillium mononematosum]|uniref:uncharacterized protein n=1 Tax=Penicillium mononematosum TaxID=268346 RepID=UPI002548C2D6|nr:uncharacterized protein N7519_007251 [Penicillium mononematosum]KAJ6185950.1 hypothetical protein N7519_007251 [Penicillium mononematosum]